MDLTCSIHQVEIVLVCILAIALLLLLIIWLYDICSWINNLYQRMQQQQGVNNEIANDPEVGPVVDNIHELFLRVWEDLGLWVHPQTLRHQRELAIEKFPPPEKYDVDSEKVGIGATGCAICLEEFVSGDLFRVLPLCKHVYHSECINRWFLGELRCPICRSSV